MAEKVSLKKILANMLSSAENPAIIARNVNISASLSSSTMVGSVTAPTVSGYTFVCWGECATQGYVGSAYPQDPLEVSTNIWDAQHTGAFSNCSVNAIAIYVRDDVLAGMGQSANTEAVDYIVEQGTSGMWRYRKWNSGIAECWGYTTAESIACTTQWGNAYYYSPKKTYSFPTGLFIPYPTINATLFDADGLGWVTICTWSETDVTINISEPISSTRTMQICFQVSGRWK